MLLRVLQLSKHIKTDPRAFKFGDQGCFNPYTQKKNSVTNNYTNSSFDILLKLIYVTLFDSTWLENGVAKVSANETNFQ